MRGARTLETMAGLLGISTSMLSKVERGQRGISLHLAIQLHKHYGVPIETWLPQSDPTTGTRRKDLG